MAGEFQSFFKVVGGNEGSKCHYPTRLDTYGCGCGHDCKYCYAKSVMRLSGRETWDPLSPKVANLAQIEYKLRALKPGTVLRLGGMTDCFQPCELEHRVTLETIKLLNKYRIGYLIVTKSHLVAEPEYMAVMDKELAHIQITVTTFDDNLSLTYEKASVPSKRVAAIEKLYKAGFDVAFRLSPYIDGFMDIARLNKVKCKKVLVEFLRVNSDIRGWFDIDYSEYTERQRSYYHLPLEKKLSILKRISKTKQVTVCEDFTAHYDYWRDHFNPNPNDCCNLTCSAEFQPVQTNPAEPAQRKRAKAGLVKVVLPNGLEVCEATVAKTMVATIAALGPKKAASVGVLVGGQPLVSPTRHTKYSEASVPIEDGYWVQTHSSSQAKLSMLNKLFAALQPEAVVSMVDEG